MRAVIRSLKTGFYYQVDEQWSPDPTGACDFGSEGLARNFAAQNGLNNIEVLCFEILKMKPPKKPKLSQVS